MGKKLLRLLMSFGLCAMLVPATALAEPVAGGGRSIAAVQALVDALPDMQDISEGNASKVASQLDAIDEAKLPLGDEELLQIDFAKYDAAAFALGAPKGMAALAVVKDYPGGGSWMPTPSLSFVSEDGQTATLMLDASGASECSALDVDPDAGARYVYVHPGTYTINEEVDGSWTPSLEVNGQPSEGMTCALEAGRAYNLRVGNSSGRQEVTITAVSQSAFYDGKPHDGYKNLDAKLPTGEPYGEALEVTYFKQGDDLLSGAPSEIGEYTVIIAVPEGDEKYQGSLELNFSITGEANFYIDASAGEGGSITPSGKVGAVQGQSLTFAIEADEGYEIADVLVDGESFGTRSYYAFVEVGESHSIHATFKSLAASDGDASQPNGSGESNGGNAAQDEQAKPLAGSSTATAATGDMTGMVFSLAVMAAGASALILLAALLLKRRTR